MALIFNPFDGHLAQHPDYSAEFDKLDKIYFFPTTVKNSNYFATLREEVRCNTTAGSFTVTLPAMTAENQGESIKIVDFVGTDALSGFGQNSLTVVGSSGATIMNSADLSIDIGFTRLTLTYNHSDTDWKISDVDSPMYNNLDWSSILNKPTYATTSSIELKVTGEEGNYAVEGDLVENGVLLQNLSSSLQTSIGRADNAVQAFTQINIKTANYIANDLDSIPCNTSGGSFSITLPSTGKVNIFDNAAINNKSGFTLHPLTVQAPAGATVMGGSDYKLFVGGTNATFELIDNDWRLIDISYPNQPRSADNVYWVDPNGDDTNSGKLPTDPLKTIKKALELIDADAASTGNYGDSNDCIKLRAGVYIEEAPLIVRRGVAIMADSLRVTEVRPTPATKNNNLFLVDSGVKFWGITFAGHQAGSFAIAFNPGADNEAIGAKDAGAYILKSPYIQNCTSYTAEDDAGLAGSLSDGATGGGLEVDGAKCASNSPIRSMVVDSFTQVNLDGPGCLVKNDGYAQLVSFFATFCTYHVKTESGGQVNLSGGGTTDFGTNGLIADGYSPSPLFTGTARQNEKGTTYAQGAVSISTSGEEFIVANNLPHGLKDGDLIKFTKTGEITLENVGLNSSESYYVVNADDDATPKTFQISETEGGNAITMIASAGIDITEGTFDFKREGVTEIDIISFTDSRLGTVVTAISRPTAGQLMFPQLVFPRDPQTEIPTPKTFGYTRIDDNTLEYYEQTSDVFHEYVDGGTVTINGTSYSVVNAIYENEAGRVEIEIDGTLPTSSSGNVTVESLNFICPNSSVYVVTGSTPIDLVGNSVAENDPNIAGYKVYFYSTTNRYLRYDVKAGQTIDFRNRSQISAPSHTFEFVGSGTNYKALPFNGGVPNPASRIVERNNGRVYSSNTDEQGNFAVGTQFAVDGTTGSVTINTDQFNLSGLNFIGPFSRNGGISTVGKQLREVSDNPALISSTGAPDGHTVPTQDAVKSFVEGKTINTGSGLTGGGDLSEVRTLALNQASIDSLALADSAVQPGDLVSSLVWSSTNW
jgi:hypothetical protein